MKRIHIGLQVTDIPPSVQFYSTLFGAPPSVEQPDYAKWMLDDPRVNFSISTGCGVGDGVHFGIQVEEAAELEAATRRLAAAGLAVRETPGVTCCYAQSDKSWAADPDGHPWETFLTHGQTTTYGSDSLSEQDLAALGKGGGCGCGAPEGGQTASEESKRKEGAGVGCC
ncbi:MAG: ArsI/CadI family heavy metal resistance metalloenzyme [Kiloniellales bacterium]